MSMNPKLLKATIFTVITILLVAAGYLFLAGKNKPTSLINENETKIPETSDWKTYRNEKYGFEFKYPNDWKVEKWGTAELYMIMPANHVLEDASNQGLLIELEIINLKNGDSCKAGNYRKGKLVYDEILVEKKDDKAESGVEIWQVLGEEIKWHITSYVSKKNCAESGIKNLIGFSLERNKNTIGVYNAILSTFKFTK